MKRKITLVVSVIQLLCFLQPISQVSADNTYKTQMATEISNAYYNKACEFTAETSDWTLNTSFYIYDIDKNGIPELIALDCTAYAGGMNYYFYTYNDGIVKNCGSFLERDAEFPYKYSDGNGVVMMYARQGYFIGTLCTLDNGVLSVVKEYSHEETLSKFDCENGSLEEITGVFKLADKPEEINYDAIYTAVNELLDVPDEAIIEAPAINVLLNGQTIAFDQPPIIIDGRTLVPLRAIFEALGATVDWDGNTQTVTATRDNIVIKITIGDNKLYVNNNVTVLDVPAQIVNDRTLVPVRAVSEAFGCNVDWDGDTQTVIITK